jgi:hypothetical protein
VVAWGNNLQLVQKQALAIAEQVKGYELKVPTDAFDKADEVIAKGKQYGVKVFL